MVSIYLLDSLNPIFSYTFIALLLNAATDRVIYLPMKLNFLIPKLIPSTTKSYPIPFPVKSGLKPNPILTSLLLNSN